MKMRNKIDISKDCAVCHGEPIDLQLEDYKERCLRLQKELDELKGCDKMSEEIIQKFSDAWKLYNTKYDWATYKKKPVEVKAIKMDKAFKVATKEGLSLSGKKGDFLIKGIRGEVYPCDKEIFKETYKELA